MHIGSSTLIFAAIENKLVIWAPEILGLFYPVGQVVFIHLDQVDQIYSSTLNNRSGVAGAVLQAP